MATITDEQLARALAGLQSDQQTPKELEQEAILQKNYEEALEIIPESFVKVNMLYVDVNIKGLHFKAFIDTGAQISIMTEFIADACGLGQLIDRQYKGVAKGVGEAQIKGRIHCLDVYLGTKILPCSFTILERQDLMLILGLDMMMSHGIVLDLKRRCLTLGDEEIEFVKGDF